MVFLAAGAGGGQGSVVLTAARACDDGAAINNFMEAPTPELPSCFPMLSILVPYPFPYHLLSILSPLAPVPQPCLSCAPRAVQLHPGSGVLCTPHACSSLALLSLLLPRLLFCLPFFPSLLSSLCPLLCPALLLYLRGPFSLYLLVVLKTHFIYSLNHKMFIMHYLCARSKPGITIFPL